MKNLLLIFFSGLFIFCSCKSTRKIQTAITPKDTTAAVVVTPPSHNVKEDSIAFINESYQHILNKQIYIIHLPVLYSDCLCIMLRFELLFYGKIMIYVRIFFDFVFLTSYCFIFIPYFPYFTYFAHYSPYLFNYYH